jgi:uncharacterized alkaline shock family protein YloU
MSESQTTSLASPTAGTGGDRSPSRSMDRSSSNGAALQSEHGVTSISSTVVAKIAGLATQEIPGVQAMGKSLSRTFGSIRSKVPGGGSPATTQGVSVEVGERQAAIDIDIVAYYGQSIVETADAIRQNVIERIEGMTGLEVVEVNISVDDLYIESDGEDATEGSRVE